LALTEVGLGGHGAALGGAKATFRFYYFIIQILLRTASMNAAPSHLEREYGKKGTSQATAVCCSTHQPPHPGSERGLVPKSRADSGRVLISCRSQTKEFHLQPQPLTETYKSLLGTSFIRGEQKFPGRHLVSI